MRRAAVAAAVVPLLLVATGCDRGSSSASVSSELGLTAVRTAVEHEVAASRGSYVVSIDDAARRILVRYDDSSKDSVSDLKRRLSAYGDRVRFQHTPGVLKPQ